MKNLLFIFALVLGVSFVSCESKTTSTTVESVDSVSMDSVSVDSTAVDSLITDSIAE